MHKFFHKKGKKKCNGKEQEQQIVIIGVIELHVMKFKK